MSKKNDLKKRLDQLNKLIHEASVKATYDDRFDDIVRNFEGERESLEREIKKLEAMELEDI